MRNKIIFIVAILGIVGGLLSAYILTREKPVQPPVFKPVSNPYETAIYANGMIESEQASGENINIFPEVSGPVTQILVREGQAVNAGATLVRIEDTVQKATSEQLHRQADAAHTLLQELKAQPRKETLELAKAQVDQAQAIFATAHDQYEKRRVSYQLDPRSISQDALDTAKDTEGQALASLTLAQKQYALTKAGAWSYEIATQEKQYQSALEAYNAASALLQKYTIKARSDGVVLAINVAAGSYVSAQGAYDSYTQGSNPIVVMSTPQHYLSVRCFIDEILVSKLPGPDQIRAEMQLRGTDIKIPLEFVRVQPYVSPKIELSNQRQEKVDLRVLPVVFRFATKNLKSVYPGQQVDVYIGKK
ncbi:HlyD family secretion protein [Oxalobacteraceae bacterium GrIS 2.11]